MNGSFRRSVSATIEYERWKMGNGIIGKSGRSDCYNKHSGEINAAERKNEKKKRVVVVVVFETNSILNDNRKLLYPMLVVFVVSLIVLLV